MPIKIKNANELITMLIIHPACTKESPLVESQFLSLFELEAKCAQKPISISPDGIKSRERGAMLISPVIRETLSLKNEIKEAI